MPKIKARLALVPKDTWAFSGAGTFVGAAIVYALASSEIQAALTLIGVIVVASMTWVGTARRQAEALGAELTKHQRQLVHDRALADLDDIRKLLDEAALDVHHAHYALAAARSGFTRHGWSVNQRAPELRERMEETGTKLDAIAGRLAVRLGPDHPVTVEFDGLNGKMLDAFRTLAAIFGDEAGHEQLADTRNELQSAVEGFDAYRHDFLDQAAKLCGTRVG